MAWKREWHVEITCEKCDTKKEMNVTCRKDEIGHATWRLSYCEKCEAWMKAKETVTPILKRRPIRRAVDLGDSSAPEHGQPLEVLSAGQADSTPAPRQ
jgi:hypothetical protein